MEHDVTLPEEQVAVSERSLWMRLPVPAAVVGAVGLLAAVLLGVNEPRQLMHSYLTAYSFFLSLALGGLFFVLLHHLTRAGWSVVVRRLAEHVAATMPLFVVLFVPLALGYHDLWEWSHPEVIETMPHKATYFSPGFFFGRAFVFLAVWTVIAVAYRRLSARQDDTGDPSISRRLRTWSAFGMVLFALTLNYASFDWLMSLEPHWFSTAFGVYLFAGCVVAILSLIILLVLNLQKEGRLTAVVTWEHFHDLGKLLFGFTVFWAYIGFSQFMLIWYGNLPEETVWYDHRWSHGWEWMSIALAAGHFGLPFLFLLPQRVKRQRGTLIAAAVWMLAMHYLDLYWIVMPALHHESLSGINPWIDLGFLVGVGGLFLSVLAALLRKRALVPLHDPRLVESIAFENV